jgi:glycosyltransferase involved in cell wall biosynthesis
MIESGFGDYKSVNQNKLKILHIAGWYPSKKKPVAGVFVREHVKATALYNHVTVLYSEGLDKGIDHFYQVEDNIEDGIRTLRLRYRKSPIPKTTYLISLLLIFRVFRRLFREGFKPDVIHAHVYSAGVPAAILGMRFKIPVVISEHFTGFPRGIVHGFERVKAKFAFEKAAVVCPVSDDLRKHIERLGIRACFQVIPNVVDTLIFSPAEKYASREGGWKHLLTVALLEPKKGIPYLLNALVLLKESRKDFVLDIVGDGPNKREYEELTNTLGLKGFVVFHGLKTKREVAEFMKKADIFVLPSEWENLPCVIIEAMASGLPIVATDVGGIPELVHNGLGVLVPPKDSLQLSQTLHFIMNHLDMYQKEHIASQARKCFSYSKVGFILDKLYRKIIFHKKVP